MCRRRAEEMAGNLEVWTGWFFGKHNRRLTQQHRNNGVCSVSCVDASPKTAQTPMCTINEVCAHVCRSVFQAPLQMRFLQSM